MVKVTRRPPPPVGGQFEFYGGYGVVITPDKALVYSKSDGDNVRKIRGRSVIYADYTYEICPIPENTVAVDNTVIPPSVRLAMESLSEAVTRVYKDFKLL